MNIITGNRNFLFLKFKLKKILRLFVKMEKVIAFGNEPNQINKIFIINLDRQSGRWKTIKQELKSIKTFSNRTLLEYSERISAIDAQKTDLVSDKVNNTYKIQDQYFVDPNPKLLNIVREKDVNIKMTKQERAVALSHISIWEKIVNENIETALILEDDVFFENDFSKKINRIWNEIKISTKHFDILFLSYKRVEFNPDIQSVKFSNLLIPKRGIWWFSGYVITKTGAKSLLSKLPVIGPIDLWINHKFNEIAVYLADKSIITQKLFLNSDNSYSILPFLSQVGVESNKTFIDLQKLKGKNPVFIFDFSINNYNNLSKVSTLLSLNSYRTLNNTSNKIEEFVDTLVKQEDTLLFDAYLGFNSLLQNSHYIINHYPNAVFIIIEDFKTFESKQFKNGNILVLNLKLDNIFKRISAFLKIKFWDISKEHITYNSIEKNITKNKIEKFNKYELLEHDVNPWVLPIHTIENYLPYSFNDTQSIVIEHLEDKRTHKFEKLDSDYWEILEGTFPSNQSYFSKNNFAILEDIGFKLDVTNKPLNEKPYTSASIVSKQGYLYGSFEIIMKPIKGDGIISAFFLHRNDPWQEIDIEFPGNDTNKILLNVYFNPGTEGNPFNYGIRGTPILIDLGFDASIDFHKYKVEWTFNEIRWYVDDNLIHLRKIWTPTPIPNLPLLVYVNAWITISENLAGKFETDILPKSLIVKEISISEYI